MSHQSVHNSDQALARTPLHGLHVELGAEMTECSGYEMPLHFGSGLLSEHLHTRAHAGLFDISHIGQIRVRPKNGRLTDAALALERLVPGDVAGLRQGRLQYGFFPNGRGRILGDFIIINGGDHLLLLTNPSRWHAAEKHLQAHISDECEIEQLEGGLLALQGPKAEAVLAKLVPGCASLRFMDAANFEIFGASCVISRFGYTGEDGFEILAPAEVVCDIAEALLKDEDAAPIGSGARNSLRLEAGLCLYGTDIDETTTPVEAGLNWAIAKCRRRGGSRPGGFPGSDIILEQLETGTSRCRVGLRPLGRTPLRAGALLVTDEDDELAVGNVTSGGFGPSLGGAPISMGYLEASLAVPGAEIAGEVLGQLLPAKIVKLPFVPSHRRRIER